MAKHRITFEFEATQAVSSTSGAKAGWSESWYHNQDVSDDDAEFVGTLLASSRRALLTGGWSLLSMRVSQLDANNNLMRRGRLVFFPPGDASGNYPGTGNDEQPYDALEIPISTAAGHRRNFQMRGIAVGVVSAGARYLDPPVFRARFNNWLSSLTGTSTTGGGGGGLFASPMAIRFRTQRTSITNPSGVVIVKDVDIQDITPGNGTTISPFCKVENVSDLATVTPGDTVVIRGVQGMQNLNGTWRVKDLNPTGQAGFRLLPKRRTRVSGELVVPGTAKFYAYSLENITAASPAYGTSRRTGRPLQLTRGRRSNRET